MYRDHDYDKSGLQQPVEDSLRDHNRSQRLMAVKNDYNRLFEMQVRVHAAGLQ